MRYKCDGVFEGGGVRGIGLVGAVKGMVDAGYEFENVAGTSAGSIIAALICASYTPEEIEKEMYELNYMDFKDTNVLDYFGFSGKILNVVKNLGIYSGDFVEMWMERLLKKKGILFFGDIKNVGETQNNLKYKLQVVATDVSTQSPLVLPLGLKKYGIDPDTFSIAKAIRMSTSIPAFYEPCVIKDTTGRDHLIVDGALYSNYPIWLLDRKTTVPTKPTFGFKFYDSNKDFHSSTKFIDDVNLFEYIKMIVTTAVDAHDNMHISTTKGDFQRSILIPVVIDSEEEKKIETVDFNITKKDQELLFNNGLEASKKFLRGWDFDLWKNLYRTKKIN